MKGSALNVGPRKALGRQAKILEQLGDAILEGSTLDTVGAVLLSELQKRYIPESVALA